LTTRKPCADIDDAFAKFAATIDHFGATLTTWQRDTERRIAALEELAERTQALARRPPPKQRQREK
jgi:hypothetical protein